MSRRAGRAAQRQRSERDVVVLAGEDQNDRRILASLVRAHRPDVAKAAKLVPISDPVRLRKKDGPGLVAAVAILVGKARAKARQQEAQLRGIVVHEDFDGFTGAPYATIRRAVATALAKAASCPSVYALAAWESEAWLLLFPDAFPDVRSGWNVSSSLRGRDTGLLASPKEKLARELRTPVFRESDGPLVMESARKAGLTAAPVGTNGSYDDFLADLRRWP